MFWRAISQGIKVDYLLMDSWFTCEAFITAVRRVKKQTVHLIGMYKTPRTKFTFNGERLTHSQIRNRLGNPKRCRKLKLHYKEAMVEYNGAPIKMFFSQKGSKGKWRVFITTDTSLVFIKMIEIYQIRWTVGVSSQGHIIQLVKVQPRLRGPNLVAREAPWRETNTVKPSDNVFIMGNKQHYRLQRAVNAEVASLHASPVAETVYNARRQQELTEKDLIRQFSPAGYQRWHVVKDNVETGETLDTRRRNIVEEAYPITLSGKWMSRYKGGGLGRSTDDRCAAKRIGRKGPRLMSAPFVQSEARVR